MSADYTIALTVRATPQQAYEAITDVAGWWGRITGTTTAVGDEFIYVVPGLHYSGFRVTELEPGARIAWLVTGSCLDFIEEKQEWNGTTVEFDLAEADAPVDEEARGTTRVTFTHRGLVPNVECYGVCTDAWGMFVRSSLKSFIETGTGMPYEFGGDEPLTARDHNELHRQVAAAGAAEELKGSSSPERGRTLAGA